MAQVIASAALAPLAGLWSSSLSMRASEAPSYISAYCVHDYHNAATSKLGRSWKKRLSTRNVNLTPSSRFEQIASTFFRDSNLGEVSVRRNLNGGPLAVRGEDFLYLLSESEGPIELPPKELEIDPFAIPEASPGQIVASFLLTGAIIVLLIRSLRRRAARAKEMKLRSSGATTVNSIQEEARKAAIDNLKKAPEIRAPLPSAGQTALGAVVAGGIAFVLYKFTVSVEGGFADKAVSTNYSIRNLTITVRTIIQGLCYLATFVFAANSVGLTLYSLQLLFGSVSSDAPPVGDSPENEEEATPDSKSEDFSEK